MPPTAKPKKGFHIKVVLVILFAVFLPYVLGLLIPLTPIFYLAVNVLSAILAIVVLFWLLKPLSTLVKSIQVFSDGNLNQRVDVRSGDEFEEVGSSFNLMAEKLAQTFHSLENDRAIAISERNKLNEILSSVIDGIIAIDFNKNVILVNKAAQEITGYLEAEISGRPIDQMIHLFAGTEEVFSKAYCQGNFNQSAKLVGKSDRQTKVHVITTQVGGTVQTNLSCILILHDLSKEEELEQMKLDFVSMASHELKTPLTSIIGYLSVFQEETKGKIPTESASLLIKAFTAAQQLQTLITNLLNVNKIEREQLSVTVEPIEYLPILTKSVEDLRAQANQKNIVLNLIPPAQVLPKVMADPIRLAEVVTNLVANAINYTDSGGKVEISTKLTPTEIATSVTDSGIGIPKEAIPHLFNKFFRVSNTEQQANKGTGLGLYITKSIIDKLHGKIGVESEVGKGSRFFFTLPIITQRTTFLNNDKFVSQAIQSGTLNY